jgi:hypothetical protein
MMPINKKTQIFNRTASSVLCHLFISKRLYDFATLDFMTESPHLFFLTLSH